MPLSAPRAPVTLLLLASLLSCAGDPIVWSGDAALRAAPGTDGRSLRLDRSGPATFAAGPHPPTLPPDSARCDGSIRIAAATAGELYAVWWHRRTNGSAALLSALSPDGGHRWQPSVPIDTVDRGSRGCDRPAPAVAADAHSGYVHVVYTLVAPEGPGIFFTHSMEHGAVFHAPVVIAYGERAARADVAATGDTVLVVYEDPNAERPQLVAALSHTAGHVFERRFPVTDGGAGAADPRVAIHGSRVAVAWREASEADALAASASVGGAVGSGDPRVTPDRAAAWLVRIGTLR